MNCGSYCCTGNCYTCLSPACLDQRCQRPRPPVDEWRWRSMIEICRRNETDKFRLPKECNNSFVSELSRVGGCSENCLIKHLLLNETRHCTPKERTVPFTDMSLICDCFQHPIYLPVEKVKKKKQKSHQTEASTENETNSTVNCPCVRPCMERLLVKKRLGPVVYYAEVKAPQFPRDLHEKWPDDEDMCKI